MENTKTVNIHVLSDVICTPKFRVDEETLLKMLSIGTTICSSDMIGDCCIKKLATLTKKETMCYLYVPKGDIARFEVSDSLLSERGIASFEKFLFEQRIPKFSTLLSVMKSDGGILGSVVCEQLNEMLMRYKDDFFSWVEENEDCNTENWKEIYSRLLEASDVSKNNGMMIICREEMF